MTLDMGNTDKLAEFRAEAERLGIERRRRPRSTAPRSPSRSRATPSSTRLPRSKASASRRWRRSSRRARATQVRRSRRFRRPHQSARRQQARAGRRSPPPAPSTSSRPTAPASSPAWTRCSARAQRAHDTAARRPERIVRRRRRARADRAAECRALAAGRALEARIRRGRLLPLRPSARRLRRGAEEAARAALGGIRPRGEGRRHRRHASPAPWCRARSGARARAARWASSACPIRPAPTRR